MSAVEPLQVAPGVYWCRGTLVNWYLLQDAHDLTLVDAGYPNDLDDLLSCVSALRRRPEDIRGVLITHAHADHLGALAALQSRYDTPAYIGEGDFEAVRTARLEQVSVATVLRQAWRPGVLPWAAAAIHRGGLKVSPASRTRVIGAMGAGRVGGAALDLPGRPVAVPTPGHTAGHTAFYLPAQGLVLTGDALVTAHPTAQRGGPQLLPAMFDTDPAQARKALTSLARLDADTLLPGHGPPHQGSLDEAIDQALHQHRHQHRNQHRNQH